MPIAFFSGTADTICPNDWARDYMTRINSHTTFIDVKDEDHHYWYLRATDPWIMRQLVAQLEVPVTDDVLSFAQ